MLTAGPLAAQAGDEPDGKEYPVVEEVVLRGVPHVDEEELRAGLATKGTECKSILLQPFCWFSDSKHFVVKHRLDPLEVERDALRIRLFYWKRGYRDTEVETDIVPADGGVEVVFTVDEGPPTIATYIGVEQT